MEVSNEDNGMANWTKRKEGKTLIEIDSPSSNR